MNAASTSAAEGANVVSRLRATARRFPEKEALVFPAGAAAFESWTYRRLDRTSDAYARGFRAVGIGRATKTIVMLKPGPDLFAIIFALFKLGAVPVIVDPGMGPERMLHCYATVNAEAFVGVPIAHLVRMARPKTFRAAKVLVTVGSPTVGGGSALSRIAKYEDTELPVEEVAADDTLVINFTTGSTGPARGVEYSHAGAAAMCDALPTIYGDTQGAVTFITLPLFALFDMLLGLTAVLAPMDPTKPAHVDSRRIADAIARFRCTHMFASPALFNRLGGDAERAGITLSSLRVVVSGGAPIMPRILDQFRRVLAPGAKIHATYGATEALPMASVESAELLGETRALTAVGHGTCAGYPTRGLEVRILSITDAPLPTMSADHLAPPGEVGEIAVRGAIVSPRYHLNPANDALAKVQDAGGAWHRTGDLGKLDDAGRLWFAGRKSHRVLTREGARFTVQCEGIFNQHPRVYRTALVGVGPRGRQRPVLCVELAGKASRAELDGIERELRALAKEHAITRAVDEVLFHPGFPVDIRHNAKIAREELATWAARRVPHAESDAGKPDARHWMRAVPIGGWLFLLYGVLFPFTHRALQAIWVIDLILSVGVHALQLVAAVPAGKRAGYSLAVIVFNTMLYGATWWKLVEPRELRGRALVPPSGGSA